MRAPADAPESQGSRFTPKANGGGHGYAPAHGDQTLLAGAIMAEAANTSEDMAAIGWAIVNRVGLREFGQALNDVIFQKLHAVAFSFTVDGSPVWVRSADPESFSGDDAISWQRACATARGILGGAKAGPTGGATFYFASRTFDGAPDSAPPGWFCDALRNDRLRASPYPRLSPPAPRTNFFFVENSASARRAG